MIPVLSHHYREISAMAVSKSQKFPPSLMAIKPAPNARVKGNPTAKAACRILERNPTAKFAYVTKGFGLKELSTQEPDWLKRRCNGRSDKVNSRTRKFFSDLGMDCLFHEDLGVRKAAELVCRAAQPGTDPVELTPTLRLALKKLSDPSDRSLEQSLFMAETGFGKQLLDKARAKLDADSVPAASTVAVTSPGEPTVRKIDDLLAPTFRAPPPGELDDHYKQLMAGKFTGPFQHATEVKAFTDQLRAQAGRAEPNTTGPVSDLLDYACSDTPNRSILKRGGVVQHRPNNRLGEFAFDDPLKAMYHLCFKTAFLRDLHPAQAAVYIGEYARLYKNWKDEMRQPAV